MIKESFGDMVYGGLNFSFNEFYIKIPGEH